MGKTITANYDFLTKAPVYRVVLVMSVPTVISMLSTSCYNMLDTYFVSLLGTEATVAVGISFVVMTILQAIGFFFGNGVGNYVAIQLGAKNRENAKTMTSVGMIYALCVGVIISVAGLIFLDPLCLWLGSSGDTAPYTKVYLRYILFSAPFVIGSFMLNLQLRMQGRAKAAMIGIISGMVLNAILDPLLILFFLLGIHGIGAATLISQAFSFIVLWIVALRSYCPPSLRLLKMSYKSMLIIFNGGFPSLVRQGLGCITILMLNLAAITYGEEAVVAMTVTTRITFLVMSVITGLAQGFQPLCGFCYGAGLYSRIKAAFKFTVLVGSILLVTATCIGLLFIHELFAVFSNDAGVIELGSDALRWQMLVFPIEAYVIVASMFLQTINSTVFASLMALARKGVLFIPLILILPHFCGFKGIEMCQPICDVFAFLLAVPIVTRVFAGMNGDGSMSQYKNVQFVSQS